MIWHSPANHAYLCSPCVRDRRSIWHTFTPRHAQLGKEAGTTLIQAGHTYILCNVEIRVPLRHPQVPGPDPLDPLTLMVLYLKQLVRALLRLREHVLQLLLDGSDASRRWRGGRARWSARWCRYARWAGLCGCVVGLARCYAGGRHRSVRLCGGGGRRDHAARWSGVVVRCRTMLARDRLVRQKQMCPITCA